MERPLSFFLAWHIQLCVPAHMAISGLDLSHFFYPVLPHRIMWHKRAAARKSLLFVRAPCVCRVLLGGWCSLVQGLALAGSPVPDAAASTWFRSTALCCQPWSWGRQSSEVCDGHNRSLICKEWNWIGLCLEYVMLWVFKKLCIARNSRQILHGE